MRTTLVTGADTQIAFVKIRTPEKDAFEIVHVSDRDWKCGEHAVPYDSMLGILQRLVNFNVFEIIGPPAAEDAKALATPLWTVEWRHMDGPQPAAPVAPKYTDYEWRIGRVVNESYYVCSLNVCPGLAFLVAAADLNLLKDVVRQCR